MLSFQSTSRSSTAWLVFVRTIVLTWFLSLLVSSSAIPLGQDGTILRRDNATELVSRSDGPKLLRRMCQEGSGDGAACDAKVPGVDTCNTQIESFGTVAKVPDVFYTEAKGTTGSRIGKNEATQWGVCFFSEETQPWTKDSLKFAAWGRICDNKWVADTSFALSEALIEAEFPDDEEKYWKDSFLKNLSQAFAEKSQGDIYLVVRDTVAPDDKSWDTSQAWGGERLPFCSFKLSSTSLAVKKQMLHTPGGCHCCNRSEKTKANTTKS